MVAAPIRKRLSLLSLIAVVGAAPVTAEAGGSVFRAAKLPIVVENCGGCHIPFSPELLPRRSWAKLMSGIDDHFGKKLEISADDAARIEKFLTGNAADLSVSMSGKRMLKDLDADKTPVRITDLPSWIRHHDEPAFREMKAKLDVKSKAACAACHDGAADGFFDDLNQSARPR